MHATKNLNGDQRNCCSQDWRVSGKKENFRNLPLFSLFRKILDYTIAGKICSASFGYRELNLLILFDRSNFSLPLGLLLNVHQVSELSQFTGGLSFMLIISRWAAWRHCWSSWSFTHFRILNLIVGEEKKKVSFLRAWFRIFLFSWSIIFDIFCIKHRSIWNSLITTSIWNKIINHTFFANRSCF